MKKFAKILSLVLVLAIGVCAMFGCGKDEGTADEYVIKGDYAEVTEENTDALAEAISKIDIEKLEALSEGEFEKIGVKASEKTSLEVIYDSAKASMSADSSIEMFCEKATTGLKLNGSVINDSEVALSKDIFANAYKSYVIAGGATAAEAAEAVKDFTDVSIKESIAAYVDGNDAYLKMNLTGFDSMDPIMKVTINNKDFAFKPITDGINGKYKFSVTEIKAYVNQIIAMIMAMGGDSVGVYAPMATSASTSTSAGANDAAIKAEISATITEMQAYLKSVNVTLSADLTDGLKLKLSTTDETATSVKTLINTYLASNSEISSLVKDLSIDTLAGDVYVSFNKEGEFEQVSGKIEAKASAKIDGKVASVDLSTEFASAFINTAPSIPSTIKNDTEYKATTVKEFTEKVMTVAGPFMPQSTTRNDSATSSAN